MTTIRSTYLGQLRVEATHMASGVTLISDAPIDNKGLGRSFSPTDLVCVALGNCMMTLMGILADREQIDLTSVTFDTIKIMANHPRKIAEIQITFDMKKIKATDVQRKKLENAAHTCPVALSLDSSVHQVIKFDYGL